MKAQQPHALDWVRAGMLEYVRIAKPNYANCIWNDLVRPLMGLGGDDALPAWRTLDKRLAGQSSTGRNNFVVQVCFILGGALALPSVSPKKAKRVADKTRTAVETVIESLPSMLPFATQMHSAGSMRLASVGASEAAKDIDFSRTLFAVMLSAFRTDIDRWERWNSRIPKPESAHASRLLFVRDVTKLLLDYFGTPLRETVAILANAAFPDPVGLAAATVAKLAPLNKTAKRATSLHVLK